MQMSVKTLLHLYTSLSLLQSLLLPFSMCFCVFPIFGNHLGTIRTRNFLRQEENVKLEMNFVWDFMMIVANISIFFLLNNEFEWWYTLLFRNNAVFHSRYTLVKFGMILPWKRKIILIYCSEQNEDWNTCSIWNIESFKIFLIKI